MATHSNVLPWEILWTKERGWLQSTGSQRVEHDLATKRKHDIGDFTVSFHRLTNG